MIILHLPGICMQFTGQTVQPDSMAGEELASVAGHAWTVESQRRLPPVSRRAEREWKDAARERFRGFAIFRVNATSIVMVQKNAHVITGLVEHVPAPQPDVRRYSKFGFPTLFVECSAFLLGQMSGQRPTAVPA
jgi:hypothetical protein